MSDLFISYASEDRVRAKQLAEALGRHGWTIWWDREIPFGKSFDQVIEEQITEARCLIVLWSVHSVASDWVKNEAREGKARGVLIPVLIEETRIPLEFRHVQTANLVGWDPTMLHPEFASCYGSSNNCWVGRRSVNRAPFSPLLLRQTKPS